MACRIVGKYKIDITGFFEKLKLSTKQQSITSLKRGALMLTSIGISYLLFKCSTQLDESVWTFLTEFLVILTIAKFIFFSRQTLLSDKDTGG
jgi:hypothetical protein